MEQLFFYASPILIRYYLHKKYKAYFSSHMACIKKGDAYSDQKQALIFYASSILTFYRLA